MQFERKEALQFIPGRMHQQDAVLDQAGAWLVQCRTTDHFDSGMTALLNVTAAPSEHPMQHLNNERHYSASWAIGCHGPVGPTLAHAASTS